MKVLVHPKKTSSMYCFCNPAQNRFTGGSLTNFGNVIEISLKFENFNESDKNNFNKSGEEKCNKLNFLELSEKTLKDVHRNEKIHECVRNLLHNVLIKKPFDDTNYDNDDDDDDNTSFITNIDKTFDTPQIITTTNVTIHQQSEVAIFDTDHILTKHENLIDDNNANDLKVLQRNSSKRSSMKSSKSMETGLEKAIVRQKDKSPDESKAKSVGNINNEKSAEENYDYENGESIELIFISDEFVNKVQKQEQEVIILDERDGKRRESLTNKKKIVIITNEYKDKVLRNNSIILTSEKKMLKKKAKHNTTHTNSFICYDEPEDEIITSKQLHVNNRDDDK